MSEIITAYSKFLSAKKPLQEYPRPQMERQSYINLNGIWQYAINQTGETPITWDGAILVPYSPESTLSGVEKTLTPDDTLWYHRFFTLEENFNVGRVLLHFGAVDQCCTVFINGKDVGNHQGGFLPFVLDITSFISQGDNELLVRVTDETDVFHFSRGRQKLEHGGIWHSPQSGIWQTVWLESVPKNYINKLRTTPLYDESAVEICVENNNISPLECEVSIFARTTLVTKASFVCGTPLRLSLQGAISWYPSRPFLYTIEIRMGQDMITSYFGMRKFGVEKNEHGQPILTLNNKPFFQRGVLDQGFYPDSMLTPPSEKAMLADLQFVKNCGFNMIRKHGKLEPMRWYYHCDRLGLLVWQDLPNGGEECKKNLSQLFFASKRNLPDQAYKRFGRENQEGRSLFIQEMEDTATLLYNTVSLAAWVLFNEGWGQFDAEKTTQKMRQWDSTRWIDHASGWHDQGSGDINSLHFEDFLPDTIPLDPQRAVVITSCGHIGLQDTAHFNGNSPFAATLCPSADEYCILLQKLWVHLAELKNNGLSGFVYSQLTDVEDEVIGLLSSDRMISKLSSQFLCELNELFDS